MDRSTFILAAMAAAGAEARFDPVRLQKFFFLLDRELSGECGWPPLRVPAARLRTLRSRGLPPARAAGGPGTCDDRRVPPVPCSRLDGRGLRAGDAQVGSAAGARSQLRRGCFQVGPVAPHPRPVGVHARVRARDGGSVRPEGGCRRAAAGIAPRCPSSAAWLAPWIGPACWALARKRAIQALCSPGPLLECRWRLSAGRNGVRRSRSRRIVSRRQAAVEEETGSAESSPCRRFQRRAVAGASGANVEETGLLPVRRRPWKASEQGPFTCWCSPVDGAEQTRVAEGARL